MTFDRSKLKGLRSEIDRGWHATELAADDDAVPLLAAIKAALG